MSLSPIKARKNRNEIQVLLAEAQRVLFEGGWEKKEQALSALPLFQGLRAQSCHKRQRDMARGQKRDPVAQGNISYPGCASAAPPASLP